MRTLEDVQQELLQLLRNQVTIHAAMKTYHGGSALAVTVARQACEIAGIPQGEIMGTIEQAFCSAKKEG